MVVFLLQRATLSLQDKTLLTAALLEKLYALPVKDMIVFEADGTMQIKGRKVEMQDAILLKQGAKALRDNFTRRVLREQMAFEAINLGVHKGLTPEMIMFSKAILYTMQEEDKLLQKLDEG